MFLFLLPNLTSYSTKLRVISSWGGGLGLNGFEGVCGPEEVECVELLERAAERRDGTEKDFLRFLRDGHEKK